MNPLLSIKKLHTFYMKRDETHHVLRSLSFSVEKGEIIGVVGESGSGKTTLAKSILRLFTSQKVSSTGEILFNGDDVLSMSEKEMRKFRGSKCAYISQDPLSALNPTMRVGEQIIEGFFYHTRYAKRKDAINKALRLLRLVEIKDPAACFMMYPHELSGGMRQRVLIASAMMNDPELLIADEPTASLDVSTQKQILALLRSLKTTILLISHDLSVVSQLCSRVLVMYGGTIVEDADVATLFQTPSHPYTQKLLAAIPSINQPKTLTPIEGTPPLLSQHAKGCPFAPRCDKANTLCFEIPPELFEIGKGRKAACHLSHPKMRDLLENESATSVR